MKYFSLFAFALVTSGALARVVNVKDKRGAVAGHPTSDSSETYSHHPSFSSPVYSRIVQPSESVPQKSYVSPQYSNQQYLSASPVAYSAASPVPQAVAYAQPSETKPAALTQKMIYKSQPQYSLAGDVSSFSYSSPVVKYSNQGVLSQSLDKARNVAYNPEPSKITYPNTLSSSKPFYSSSPVQSAYQKSPVTYKSQDFEQVYQQPIPASYQQVSGPNAYQQASGSVAYQQPSSVSYPQASPVSYEVSPTAYKTTPVSYQPAQATPYQPSQIQYQQSAVQYQAAPTAYQSASSQGRVQKYLSNPHLLYSPTQSQDYQQQPKQPAPVQEQNNPSQHTQTQQYSAEIQKYLAQAQQYLSQTQSQQSGGKGQQEYDTPSGSEATYSQDYYSQSFSPSQGKYSGYSQ